MAGKAPAFRLFFADVSSAFHRVQNAPLFPALAAGIRLFAKIAVKPAAVTIQAPPAGHGAFKFDPVPEDIAGFALSRPVFTGRTLFPVTRIRSRHLTPPLSDAPAAS